MSDRHATWLAWRAEEAIDSNDSNVKHGGWCSLQALRAAALGDNRGAYRWLGKAYAALMGDETQ